MPDNRFELIRSHSIPALKLEVQEYRHGPTGAQHVHLAADNQENVFLVALRTVPQDSRGVAHILEHTALCGSEKYQVRDPFFMMTRRSLNTFMNAFTSSDWTAYPFASQSRKDYFNLLDVYLDAVFFPRLDPLDFAQEGHRLEFADPTDSQSPLTIKGIVYNEMKGAMSSPVAQLWHQLCEHLYPTTTYHYNSGGDPEHIPGLDYQDLINFHHTHYHPGNAIFMTFGNLDPAEIQSCIESGALNRFAASDAHIEVPLEQRFTAPKAVEASYPLDDEPLENKTHVVLGWLLGDSTDLTQVMEAQLLTSILLENSASPLQQALETTPLGKAPSPLCGLDDSQRELCFVCGLEGCSSDAGEDVEALILDTLEQVALEGLPHEDIEACLHQLEIHQREISGDGMPYGLHLMMTALNSATHRGDPAALLDLEPVIRKLRKAIENPEYIKGLARKYLLDNPHRLRLVMRPDTGMRTRQAAREQSWLEERHAAMSDTDKARIVERAKALQDRQMQDDNPDLLPKVTLADVPDELKYPERRDVSLDEFPFVNYDAGTNGIVYQQIIAELPQLETDELVLLPLLTHLMTEVGLGGKSYLETQKWQSRVSGGIHASYLVRALPDDVQSTRGYFSLVGKSLTRNQEELCALMQASLESCRFDESQRLREIVSQARVRNESAITGSGHSLAMAAAAQNLTPVARLTHRASGLAGITDLKHLDDGLDKKGALDNLLSRLAALHQKLLGQSRTHLVIAEPEALDAANRAWRGYLTKASAEASGQAFALDPLTPGPANQMWIANTRVHFCARAYPTVPSGHKDAPALSVLAGLLRNNFLHRAIREQGGAYGGGASQDNSSGVFRFFSYRDPRLHETLEDFDASVNWLLQSSLEERLIEEAILGVIAQLDKPASPAGEARHAFLGELFGHSRASRDRFRRRVLEVTMEDLRRVAQSYLLPERASTAVLTHSESQNLADELGLTVLRL